MFNSLRSPYLLVVDNDRVTYYTGAYNISSDVVDA